MNVRKEGMRMDTLSLLQARGDCKAIPCTGANLEEDIPWNWNLSNQGVIAAGSQLKT